MTFSATGAPADRPAAVVAAVALARSGEQAEAAGRLGLLADDADPLTAWTATAAVLPSMWWDGRFSEAAGRVSRTLEAVGPLAQVTALPQVGVFVTAFAAAAVYDGADPRVALVRALDVLPEQHRQHRLLSRNADRLSADPSALLPRVLQDPQPLLSGQAALAARGPAALTGEQRETVLLEAINCGQRDLVLDWVDSGVPVPRRSWALLGVAEMLIERDRGAEVEPLLIQEATAWVPAAWWETVSWQIPLGSRLRAWVTQEVRQAHLERPVAVGVS